MPKQSLVIAAVARRPRASLSPNDERGMLMGNRGECVTPMQIDSPSSETSLPIEPFAPSEINHNIVRGE